MRKFHGVVLAVVLASAASGSVLADQKLSVEEARNLFTNKTFDGVNEKNKRTFVVYSAADGKHNVSYPNGSGSTGKWSVNDAGEHCVELAGNPACGSIISKDDGAYQKVDSNGDLLNTFRNFRDGDRR